MNTFWFSYICLALVYNKGLGEFNEFDTSRTGIKIIVVIVDHLYYGTKHLHFMVSLD